MIIFKYLAFLLLELGALDSRSQGLGVTEDLHLLPKTLRHASA